MTFGSEGFGTAPFCAAGRAVRAYFDMALDLSAELTVVLYVSNAPGYATRPDDSLRSQPFAGRLEKFSFQRSILQNNIGEFTTGAGQLVIKNTDAFYDELSQVYTIDGRPITIYIGRSDGAFDDAVLVARLTARGWLIAAGGITIDLVDFSYKLEVPLQPNVYGGTGGQDGGPDLAGKRKPLALGTLSNITPVVLVTSLLIYQVHDGSVQSIDVVYDGAAALTNAGNVASYAALVAASVTAGTFVTCVALGLFKLGQAPAQQVTADVHGENTSGFKSTTADIVRWAIATRSVLMDPEDLAVSSFDDVNATQPAPVGFYHGPDDELTVAAFCQKMMGGIGGWCGHRLDGTFEVRIFQAPSGDPVASFTRDDMLLPDIEKEPLPDAYNPPPYRWRVPYQRNWTVQTSGLLGTVSADRRAYVAEPYRLAEVATPSIQADHPFAHDRDPVEAYFANQADAQAEAQRLTELFKVTRSLYRQRVPRRGLRRDMGDVIKNTHPRHDLSFGRLMTLVEVNIDIDFTQRTKIDAVELVSYG